jgi:outer membrane protein TolC
MRSREAVLQKSDRPRLLLQSALFARGTGASPDGSFAGGADGLWFDRANWAAGVQVVFPNLFDGSSLHARQAAAAADSHVEDARREEALLEVTSQQQSAAAIAEGAIAIAQNTPVQLSAARQSESQARARYDAGLASIVEVAESQGLLAAAEYQDSIARLDVWRALLGQAVASGDLTPFLERVRTAGAP